MRAVVSDRRPLALPAVALSGCAAYALLLFHASATRPYDLWAALVVAPALLLATVPLARRLAREEDDPRLVRLLLWAVLLKLAASVVRYLVAFDVYDGVADAAGYARRGAILSGSYRSGVFTGLDVHGKLPGTGFVTILTGVVFAVTGPSALGGFLAFSWLGFVGLALFYAAFRLGCAEGDSRRYAQVLFLLPSLLFWPSSIGKEAWMMLTLGVSAYGVARVLQHRRGGFVVLLGGLVGVACVRPHMSILVVAAATVAYALRGSSGRRMHLAARVLGVALLVLASLVALRQTEEFFGLEEEGVSGVDSALTEAAERTSQGGSAFAAEQVRSPAQLPAALFAVMFRPLPHEAHNAQALIASLEGVALLGLFALSWPRLRRIFRTCWQHPYILFAVVYTLLFVVAFSSFGNFGILTRQRVQMFPFALVLLAIPQTLRPVPVWRARN